MILLSLIILSARGMQKTQKPVAGGAEQQSSDQMTHPSRKYEQKNRWRTHTPDFFSAGMFLQSNARRGRDCLLRLESSAADVRLDPVNALSERR